MANLTARDLPGQQHVFIFPSWKMTLIVFCTRPLLVLYEGQFLFQSGAAQPQAEFLPQLQGGVFNWNPSNFSKNKIPAYPLTLREVLGRLT